MSWASVAVLLVALSGAGAADEFEFTSLPVDTALNEGDPLNLTCGAVLVSDPTANLSYSWSRNGILLSNSSRLLFEAVTARDGGEYSCNVSSLQGELGAVATAVVTVRPTTGGYSVELVLLISLISSLGTIGMVVIALLLVMWFAVCKDRPYTTWDKLRRSSDVRRKSQSSQEEILITANKRSKSFGHLIPGEHDFEDPYDRNLSNSTERLLSGAENTVHPPDNLDFDLFLDERLFDTKLKNKQTKTLSESKQSDPISNLKSSLSQRTSLASSAASDLGEELTDSQTSSIFKSVRFDLDDSGVSTDNNPSPLRLKRRYSEPNVRYFSGRSPQRDDLVSEGANKLYSDSEGDEGLGSDHRLELSHDNQVSNIVWFLSSSQSDSSAVKDKSNAPINSGHVSEIKERFQQEVKGQEFKGQEVSSEPRQRVRSISKRVSETTKQLMESKADAGTSVTKPGKLVGLDREVGIPMVGGVDSPDDVGVDDDELERFEQSRKCSAALPFFGAPLSLSPWQPRGTADLDEDSDDNDDDALVAPLKVSSGVANISPFKRGGLLFLGGPMSGHEMFIRSTPPRTPTSRKNSASRLSCIPEESPQNSTISLIA